MTKSKRNMYTLLTTNLLCHVLKSNKTLQPGADLASERGGLEPRYHYLNHGALPKSLLQIGIYANFERKG